MPWDFQQEVGRKVIHLLSILFLVIYGFFAQVFNRGIALLALAFLLIILIEFEYVRIELKAKLPVVSYFWKRFKRKSEQQRLGGEIFFLLGAIICLAVFDLRVAVSAILMTTFGDLSAAIVGKYFGSIWLYRKRKALEGILAEFFIDIVVGIIFLRSDIWWLDSILPHGDILWIPIVLMALTATFVETVVTKIDDNLLIPLFAGFIGHILVAWLGI
ncbi:CTP--2,3-di-O-geranylgeranyl-sn-glycero-1-phosphate cytidyltransferase [Candidatus Woesearchaeota archaeon]|nr:CTP--2,3-di-O-geranylgeranyl-sn-glycero-1-phosphate cytidyltransferase [Candidatus Woesearchaeota archaeon]